MTVPSKSDLTKREKKRKDLWKHLNEDGSMEIKEVLQSFGKDGKNHTDVEAEFYNCDQTGANLVSFGEYKFTKEEIERILDILKFVEKMNQD